MCPSTFSAALHGRKLAVFVFAAFLLLIGGNARAQGTVATDRAALVALYNATDGANWTNNTNWTSAELLGEWEGVTTDSAGRVTALELSNNRLSGEIPAELPRFLGRLDLSGNKLSGTIPWELGLLRNLQFLSLWGNELSGEIPWELGGLGNLQWLLLGENKLSGEIPWELENLGALQYLYLNNNTLSGTIPWVLGELRNLQSLVLSGNKLSGTIPWSLRYLGNLQRLSLWDNELSGEIPAELGNLASLQWLFLSGNKLTGTIPAALGNLSSLQRLFLGGNELIGTIPAELGNLANLQQLSLGENELSGTIPAELGGLANLLELFLHNNKLSGTIPAELGNLASLQWLVLDGNELSGEIPAELGNLASLQWLFLGENELSGTIPAELGDLTNLRLLHLHENKLSGAIPAELGDLANLRYLFLHNNELTGSIPSWLGNLPELLELSLWSNELSGPIPPGVAPAQDRAVLRVLYNETGGEDWTNNMNWLSGEPLSKWYGVTTDANGRVTILSLSANGLTGTIGAELGVLTRLTGLYLNGNTLSGPLPLTLAQLSQLSVLDIQSTTLCAPTDATFQAWLATINFQGSVCDGPTTPPAGPTTPPAGPQPAADWTIDTFAGSGASGDGGDGGPATDAQLYIPSDVAVDGAGNLYIADTYNHRIRKVDSSGVITTVAGTGESGFSYGAPDGSAVLAQLAYPGGVAGRGVVGLYIADSANHRIRGVSSWRIGNVAGTGRRGFSGDGGPANEATLYDPSDMAVDGAGNLYIADTYNQRIRKVDTTGTIDTVAGTGRFGFSGDGGPATAAQLWSPQQVVVDHAGNLYIADSGNHRIRKVDSTGTITTVAGTRERGFGGDGGPAVAARLNNPNGVAVDRAGNLYIADYLNHRIRKVDSTGTITTVAGTGEPGFSGDGGPAVAARLNNPSGMAVDGAGNIYITDSFNHRIRILTPMQTEDQIYYFPHLAVGAGWQTTITYINYSPEEVTCQTDFLSDHGSPLMVSFAGRGAVDSRTDVLPPGGSVHQETNVDLSAPLAPGWARATCSGPVKASLLFRQHNSEGVPTAEAAVNAATVPATRFVTFAEQGEGRFGTGVAYANPFATAALVTFTARDAAGEVLATDDLMLSPGGHDAHGMSELFDLTSFTGSIEVTSTEPIVSLSLNFEAYPVFSSLPPGELDPSAQGSTTYYFPHLAVGASWQTTITYINFSPEEVTCQTEFISDYGTPLMVSFAGLGPVVSRTDVLPPGGSVHEETDVELSAPLAPGWARATCSGPVKASLLFRQRNSEGVPTAEAAVNAAAVPATRFVTFAEQQEGKAGTGVAYANPSSTSALVTFTARDAAGRTLASVDRTLLPGGHDAQNMVPLFGLTSFTGSIEVASPVPIVSLSLNFEAYPVFSSLPPGELDPSAQ